VAPWNTAHRTLQRKRQLRSLSDNRQCLDQLATIFVVSQTTWNYCLWDRIGLKIERYLIHVFDRLFLKPTSVGVL
jgi:hypothetical protein